jgi:hypothetical protein
MYPWLLVLPFAVTLFIVGGILLILAGKYLSSNKSDQESKGSVPYALVDKTKKQGGSMSKEGTVPSSKETVLITLTDLPQGSFVFIDNVLEESNPLQIARSFKSVKVRIEAEGFEMFETEIVPSTDLVFPVNMELKKSGAGGKKTGKKKHKGGQQLDLLTDFPE